MRKSVGGSYVRTIRKELDRFATWPVQSRMSLGRIGRYHGRTATFEWEGSLSELGVNVDAEVGVSKFDELYTSSGKVDVDFRAADSPTARVDFAFSRSRAVAMQGRGTSHAYLPLRPLARELNRILRNGATWTDSWLVVTELWKADAFAMLVSGGGKATASISAAGLAPGCEFNLSLGGRVVAQKNMVYCAITDDAVAPFFKVHRLVSKGDEYLLKPYGSKLFGWI